MDRHLPLKSCTALLFVITLTLGADRAAAAAVASGAPLKDATNILDYYNNKHDPDSIKSILAGYGVRDPTDAVGNPFLAKVIFLKPARAAAPVTTSPTLGIAQGGEAYSPFSASSVANALATLIAERVKQDAEILALQALSAEIARLNGDPRYDRPLEKLLPLSTRYVESVNPSAADPAMWSVLQSDFRQDLQGLPNSLPKFFDSLNPPNKPLDFDRYVLHMGAALGGQIAVNAGNPYDIIDALARESSDFYARQQQALLMRRLPVLEAAAGLSADGQDLPTRIHNLQARQQQRIDADDQLAAQLADQHKAPETAQTQKALANRIAQSELQNRLTLLPHLEKANAVFQSLAVLSHALTIDRKSTWAKPQDLKAYLTTPVTGAGAQSDPLFLLLGLSYAADSTSWQAIAQAIPRYQRPTPIAAVQALADDLQNSVNRTAAFADAAGQVLTQLARLPSDVKVLSDTTKKYTLADAQTLIVDLGGVATHVCNAINDVAQDTVPPEDINAIQQWQAELYTLAQVVTSARTGDYKAAAAALIIEIPRVLPKEPVEGNGVVKFIAREGPLVASLASATNQDEFTAALDSFALPAGSFTQIQHESHSWTLNAYFGGELGAEILTGNLGGITAHRVAPRVGFTAPVGVAYNWAHPSPNGTQSPGVFKTGSQSVFFSVLDVGALASFRLQSGNGGRTVAVRWSNIVAPGLYYVWTMKDTPVSLMIGTAYGPELRDVSATGGTTLQRAVWQLPILAVSFNLPLFQFSGQ